MNAPMKSRYHESLRRLEGATRKASGREAAREIDWYKPGDRVFDPDAGDLRPLVRRRRMQHLPTTPSTAT